MSRPATTFGVIGVRADWASGHQGFSTASLRRVAGEAAPRWASGRIALPVAGDLPEAVACVLGLVDDFGFDAVEAGGSSESWRQQTGAPAYCDDLDAAALRRTLAGAERGRVAQYGAERESYLRWLIGGES